jgi:hypothetical protein
MNTQELELVLGKLKTVNEELGRVQNSLINALDREVSLIEVLQERFHQRDEVVLEKVVYRVKANRSIDL